MIPSIRGILILLLAAPIIALGVLLPAFEWIGWLYALSILILFYTDWRTAGRADRFDVRRDHETKLSLGVQNPVTISIRNRFRRSTSFEVRDEARPGRLPAQLLSSQLTRGRGADGPDESRPAEVTPRRLRVESRPWGSERARPTTW